MKVEWNLADILNDIPGPVFLEEVDLSLSAVDGQPALSVAVNKMTRRTFVAVDDIPVNTPLRDTLDDIYGYLEVIDTEIGYLRSSIRRLREDIKKK